MTTENQAPDPAQKWEGAEEWMPLAWELCANECGEEACTELIWEGGPIPEPWGDRWLKYEDQAKEMIAMVRASLAAVQAPESALRAAAQRVLDDCIRISNGLDGSERHNGALAALRAALAIPAPEGAQVTDDMRSAVRWAPSSAYWSERLREFFGPDAREGIDALERQLRAALAAPAPQAAPRAWLITADDDGSADWVELGAAQPEPVEGFRAVPLGPLAALQAAPVALTDEQIAAGWKAWPEQAITSAAKAVRFVRSLGIPALQTKEPTNDR